MMYPFRSRVKEYVQCTDKLSLIGLTFHAGESYWGIHPYNYHIDDFTPLLPWNISKSSGIDWMEIELVNILFSLLQLSTWCHCSYILSQFWFPISLRTGWSLLSLTSVLRFLSLGECIMLHLCIWSPAAVFIGWRLWCKAFHNIVNSVFFSFFIFFKNVFPSRRFSKCVTWLFVECLLCYM